MLASPFTIAFGKRQISSNSDREEFQEEHEDGLEMNLARLIRPDRRFTRKWSIQAAKQRSQKFGNRELVSSENNETNDKNPYCWHDNDIDIRSDGISSRFLFLRLHNSFRMSGPANRHMELLPWKVNEGRVASKPTRSRILTTWYRSERGRQRV